MVVGYALLVELVEFGVYVSAAVMLALTKTDLNTKKATQWTKIGCGYTACMFKKS